MRYPTYRHPLTYTKPATFRSHHSTRVMYFRSRSDGQKGARSTSPKSGPTRTIPRDNRVTIDNVTDDFEDCTPREDAMDSCSARNSESPQCTVHRYRGESQEKSVGFTVLSYVQAVRTQTWAIVPIDIKQRESGGTQENTETKKET